jgi:hypothetical protein
MTRLGLLYAALVGVSLSVACNSSQQQQQSSGPGANPIVAQGAPWTLSPQSTPASLATATAAASCTNPGANVLLYNLLTGRTAAVPSSTIYKWAGSPGLSSITSWTIYGQRWLPAIPVILGEVTQYITDRATLEILPYQTPADQTLANAYVAHLKFVASFSENARNAQLQGLPLPSANPQQLLADELFLGSTPPPPPPPATASPPPAKVVSAIEVGNPPADQDFEDANYDPNSFNPHVYDFTCSYLAPERYLMIWKIETQIQQLKSVSYQNVVGALNAGNAQPREVYNVGWVPDRYLTFIATAVPREAPLAVVFSPSPGWATPFLQPFAWRPVACFHIAPLPTPGTPPPAGLPPTASPSPQACALST